jgi:(p)ppGpp synthase/HD superfamily hydrolase
MEQTSIKQIDIDKPMRLVHIGTLDTYPAPYVIEVLFHNGDVCLVELDDFENSSPYLLFNLHTGTGTYLGQEFMVVNFEDNAPSHVSLPDRAREFVRRGHRRINQYYDGKPYIFHIDMAAATAHQFKHLIPEEKWELVLAGIYLHDIAEDSHAVTYNNLKEEFGEEVANFAHALANEKGKTRDERANDKYYREMREVPYAIFGKLCDRIANIQHGINTGGSMLKRYRKEHAKFVEKTYDPQ